MAAGNLVLFGFVQDAASLVEFPTTAGAEKRTRNGSFDFDVFVTKFNASATTMIFSTMLGGERLRGLWRVLPTMAAWPSTRRATST